jgi:type I restriction enzyme, S subunit
MPRINWLSEPKSRKQIDKLNLALLDKAFKGELVPQDPTDEPAATLLAKIQQATKNQPKTTNSRKLKASKEKQTITG